MIVRVDEVVAIKELYEPVRVEVAQVRLKTRRGRARTAVSPVARVRGRVAARFDQQPRGFVANLVVALYEEACEEDGERRDDQRHEHD